MKRMLMSLMIVLLMTGMSMAMDLTGKNGIGVRANNLSFRHFVNNNFGFDIGADYSNATLTGLADSNNYNYALGGFWAKEIYKDVLLEIGATVQGWHGFDSGVYYNGVSINPFVGAECFINEHFAVDGKVFIPVYGSQMSGITRSTNTSLFSGNLGAHIYF